ncbi:MAG: hydrogenase-4 component G [Campylobacterales bacterium]
MQVTESSKYQSYMMNIKASLNVGDESIVDKNGLSDEAKEKIKNGELSAKSLSNSYLFEFSLTVESYSSTSFEAQNGIFDINKVKSLTKNLELDKLGYKGKPIGDLTPDEAKELVGEDGFFGVSKTSDRLADFVIAGGGDNIDKLKSGREGIIKGFKDAEALWGEKLPDISYETLDKALEKIDKRIEELGGKALDVQA